MIRHYALAEDYFDGSIRVRLFVCEDCGAVIGNEVIEAHERFHLIVPAFSSSGGVAVPDPPAHSPTPVAVRDGHEHQGKDAS